MNNLTRFFSWLIVVSAAIFLGYSLGKFFTSKPDQTSLTENYSFVKYIAELASLEVSGTTTLTNTNVTNDGSWTDAFKKVFIERTVRLSVPYTAKYGVNMNDSALRIIRTDSLLKVYLPEPKLLSYEIHLDRLEASNRKGWFQFENEETYPEFQKKLYAQSRARLEQNQTYLKQSKDKICDIISKYFAPLHVKTVCIYEEGIGGLKPN